MLTPKQGQCRILYLVGQLGAGGLERQLYLLLKGIDKDRYRPAVAVWNYCAQDVYVPLIRELSVPIYPLCSSDSAFQKLKMFYCLVKDIQPEVIHSYSFYTNFPASLATLGTKTKAIGSVRSDFDWAKATTGTLLGRLSARWPRTQIFNSQNAAEKAYASGSFFRPFNSIVVRNGIDLDQFGLTVPPIESAATILGVGSLLPVKRWDRVITAASVLKQRGRDFSVNIAGDGPLRSALEQQAQRLQVENNVHFLGHRDDVPCLQARIKAFGTCFRQ